MYDKKYLCELYSESVLVSFVSIEMKVNGVVDPVVSCLIYFYQRSVKMFKNEHWELLF